MIVKHKDFWPFCPDRVSRSQGGHLEPASQGGEAAGAAVWDRGAAFLPQPARAFWVMCECVCACDRDWQRRRCRERRRQREAEAALPSRVPTPTYASDVNGDIHVAVLGAVVHGLPQGPQLGLAVAAGTQGGRGSVCQVSALGQNLLQGQDVALLLLWLSQQFAEHIPVNHKPNRKTLREAGGWQGRAMVGHRG